MIKPKLNYTLSIRYDLGNGIWSNYQDHGQGIFESMDVIYKQARILRATLPGKKTEVKFTYQGKDIIV